MEHSIIPSCLFNFGRKLTGGNILPGRCHAVSIIQFTYITVINIVGKAKLDGSDAQNVYCYLYKSRRNLTVEVYLNCFCRFNFIMLKTPNRCLLEALLTVSCCFRFRVVVSCFASTILASTSGAGIHLTVAIIISCMTDFLQVHTKARDLLILFRPIQSNSTSRCWFRRVRSDRCQSASVRTHASY